MTTSVREFTPEPERGPVGGSGVSAAPQDEFLPGWWARVVANFEDGLHQI